MLADANASNLDSPTESAPMTPTVTATTRLLSQSRQESVGELFFADEDRAEPGFEINPEAVVKGVKRSISPTPNSIDSAKRLKESHVSPFIGLN